MLLSSVLLLLLIGGLQAEPQEKEVSAMVGSDVELSCIYPKSSSFDLNDLLVYWQITESKTVVMYHLPENSSTAHQDSQYKNRAHLSLDSMKRGNFSLHLRNVTPQDEQKFHCLVFRKSLELGKILEAKVKLHVAANYSMPIVSTPKPPSQDEELTFTCMSKDGYPRPNVYWINKTDNSLLDGALQNHSVSLNARGLYDVVSVLRIPRSTNVNVGCCIENVLLHQNLTAASQSGAPPEDPNNPDDRHKEKNVTLYSVLGLLAVVAAAVAMGGVYRSRCRHRSYTGAQAVPLELEHRLPDHC